MLMLEIGKLGGDGRFGADFRKVLFAELKGKWDAGKIGRSSLEMIETGLYSMLRARFSKESCVRQSWEIQQIGNFEKSFHL
jgi:hypothetical protein